VPVVAQGKPAAPQETGAKSSHKQNSSHREWLLQKLIDAGGWWYATPTPLLLGRAHLSL
jgi:hypothetical protein